MRTFKPKQCELCGKTYFSYGIARKDWITRRFCSRECSDIARRGTEKTPTVKLCQVCGGEMHKIYEESWKRWNKKKFCSRACTTKGTVYKAPSTAFKKGDIPHNFKKEGYGYEAVHQWLNRHHMKSGICEECKNERKTQWANISGNYLRDITDYKELCRSCHAKFDLKDPKKPELKFN